MELNGVEGWKYLLLVASSTKLVNHWLVTKKIVFCKTEKANDMKYYLVRLCFSKWELSRNTTSKCRKKTTTKKVFLLMNLVEKSEKQITQQDRERRKKNWKEGKNVETFLYFFFLSCDKKMKEKQYPKKAARKKSKAFLFSTKLIPFIFTSYFLFFVNFFHFIFLARGWKLNLWGWKQAFGVIVVSARYFFWKIYIVNFPDKTSDFSASVNTLQKVPIRLRV